MDCEECTKEEARVAIAPTNMNARGMTNNTKYVCLTCAWNAIKHESHREVPLEHAQDATTISTDEVTRIGNETGELRTPNPTNLSDRE